MRYSEVARLLVTELDLRFPPSALAFVDEPPPDIPRADTVEPSGCAFWRRAEEKVFYATAEDHFSCPLGAMVMGMPLPEERMAQLQDEVGMMCGVSYVREEEVEHVPKVARASAGIVYGPLEQFPLDPAAVLLWLTPRQAMVMSECFGLMNWSAGPTGILGRPGCGAIPIALAGGMPAQSYGCTGMRINTAIPEELLLMVVPGTMLDSVGGNLDRVREVHRQMESHYLERIAGLRPS